MPDAQTKYNPVRRFTLAYIASLGLLVFLAVAGMFLEEWALTESKGDTHEVNLAGRQRMLSERLAKLMLSTSLTTDGGAQADFELLSRTLRQWQKNHHGLWHGDEMSHLPGARTGETKRLFSEIEPAKKGLANAVSRYLDIYFSQPQSINPGRAPSTQRILHEALASQKVYASKMDQIVATLEKEAVERLNRSRYVDSVVLSSILLTLVLLGYFVLRPITNRLRDAMERIERERSGLAGFVHNSPSPIIQLRPDGEATAFNQGAEELLSSLPDPPANIKDKARSLLKGCLEQPDFPFTCDNLEVSVAGRHYLFHFSYMQSSEQVFAFGVDITSRKRAEEAIAEARDAAEAANRMKSEFLATMSHELRTPLNAIIGFSDALMSGVYGALESKQLAKLEHVLSSGRHLLTLVEAVLSLSQIEAGHVTLNVEAISVNKLLEAGLEMIKQAASAKGITASIAGSPQAGDLTIRADERKLKQVLLNLLSNAVKFTPEGGKITLSTSLEQDGRELLINVTDNGIGLLSGDAKGLFEAFYQADSALNRQYYGTGLGLALCRRLVEMHGGRIWAHSNGRNLGSTFTLALPLDLEHSGSIGAEEAAS